MNAIKVSKDPRYRGMFSLKWGKRRASLCVSVLDEACGLAPGDDDCRRAFNDLSGPGDEIAGSLVPVHRMDVASGKGRLR